MKRMKVEAKTTVSTYRNKRNGNKYVEKHEDGYGHRSLKQYMKWDRDDGEVIKNPTGDGNLHRWHKDNADELLEDYEKVTSAVDVDSTLADLQAIVQDRMSEFDNGAYNDEYYGYEGGDAYAVGSFEDAIHWLDEQLDEDEVPEEWDLMDALDVSGDLLSTPDQFAEWLSEHNLTTKE